MAEQFITKEKRESVLTELLLEAMEPTITKGGFVVFINGQRMKLSKTGKSIWAEKRHAMCALSNAVKDDYEKRVGYDYHSSVKYKEIIDELIRKGVVEIKPLTQLVEC